MSMNLALGVCWKTAMSPGTANHTESRVSCVKALLYQLWEGSAKVRDAKGLTLELFMTPGVQMGQLGPEDAHYIGKVYGRNNFEAAQVHEDGAGTVHRDIVPR
jgi:hypothetical protein